MITVLYLFSGPFQKSKLSNTKTSKTTQVIQNLQAFDKLNSRW